MVHSKRPGLRRAKFLSVSLLSLVFSVLFLSCNQDKAEYTDFAACGMSLPVDRSYVDKGLLLQSFGRGESEYPALYAYFQYIPALEALNEEMGKVADGEMTEEMFDGFMERAMLHYRQLAVAYAVPKAEYEDAVRDGGLDGKPYAGMKKIGNRNDYVYLASYGRTGLDRDGMDAEEKSLYEDCAREVEKAFRKVRFIDMEDSSMTAASAMPASVPDFQSFDVQGKPMSQELFSGADLTVVNVWGTFCGPCIKELPELAEWSDSLPAGVQLVGLVCDVSSPDDAAGIQEARDILDKAGVRFTNVLASDDLQVFLSGIQFVPTTFLVDGKGNIIGDPIVGADVRKYKRAVDACLQKK